MKQPLVFVVIVNWNGEKWLRTCIPSLLQTEYPNYKVIVVDNGSSDGSKRYLYEHHPAVQVIDLGENLGFAAGNNRGIRAASRFGAKYVALLNNDTYVTPEWLIHLIDIAETNPQIALCEGQQLTWDGRHRIRLQLRLDWLEGQLTLAPPVFSEGYRLVPYAAGCCVLIRCEALDQIGLFDPHYFAYVEDVDLSLRAWSAGYEVASVQNSIIYHHVKGTSTTHQQMALGYRNQLVTMLRNYQVGTLRKYQKSIVRRWLFTRNRIALGATLDVMRSMPRVLRSRDAIQRMRVRSDEEIFALTDSAI